MNFLDHCKGSESYDHFKRICAKYAAECGVDQDPQEYKKEHNIPGCEKMPCYKVCPYRAK